MKPPIFIKIDNAKPWGIQWQYIKRDAAMSNKFFPIY